MATKKQSKSRRGRPPKERKTHRTAAEYWLDVERLADLVLRYEWREESLADVVSIESWLESIHSTLDKLHAEREAAWWGARKVVVLGLVNEIYKTLTAELISDKEARDQIKAALYGSHIPEGIEPADHHRSLEEFLTEEGVTIYTRAELIGEGPDGRKLKGERKRSTTAAATTAKRSEHGLRPSAPQPPVQWRRAKRVDLLRETLIHAFHCDESTANRVAAEVMANQAWPFGKKKNSRRRKAGHR